MGKNQCRRTRARAHGLLGTATCATVIVCSAALAVPRGLYFSLRRSARVGTPSLGLHVWLLASSACALAWSWG